MTSLAVGITVWGLSLGGMACRNQTKPPAAEPLAETPATADAVAPAAGVDWYQADSAEGWDLPVRSGAGNLAAPLEESQLDLPAAKKAVDCTDDHNCAQHRQATLLTISTNTPKALILIDEILVGTDRDPIAVKPGSFIVHVQAEGFQPQQHPIKIKQGEKLNILLEMKTR